MISIEGLTERQRILADIIWACETMDQAQALVKSLQGEDRRDAVTLMTVMIHEVLEERIDDYSEAASNVIAGLRS